jgi:prophage regulatory protein
MQAIHPSDERLRLLSTNQVLDLIGFSRMTLYRKVKEGTFPKPVSKANVGKNLWKNTDIRVWIDGLDGGIFVRDHEDLI